MKVRVSRRRAEAPGICSYELVSPDGSALPSFEAGAHIDVHLPGGITRQYSLCNDPRERGRYVIAVLKDAASRGGSVAMHEQVAEGGELEIGLPRNHFALAQPPQHSLLLAGGIGITPILAMAETLSARGLPFELHYCARSASAMAFRTRIESSAFAGNAFFHLDDGPPAQKLDLPALLARFPASTDVYICGPQGFIRAMLGMARAAGWAEAHLHREFFGAETVSSGHDEGFDVRLARSGKVVRVRKEQTVVQALAAEGVELQVSCEQGVCGTCLTRVLEGSCDHRDMYLTEDERGKGDSFLPCVSRARSDLLVLDI